MSNEMEVRDSLRALHDTLRKRLVAVEKALALFEPETPKASPKKVHKKRSFDSWRRHRISKAVSAYWQNMSPKERRAEVLRRMAARHAER